MFIFQSSEKTITTVKNKNIPHQLRDFVSSYAEEEVSDVIYYSAPLGNIKDRLELNGYTLSVAKKAYNISLKKEIDRYVKDDLNFRSAIDKETLQVLQEMNLEIWLSTLREIYENNLNLSTDIGDDNVILSYMLNQNFYGFIGEDLNILNGVVN